jgi:uncharacterized protein YggE
MKTLPLLAVGLLLNLFLAAPSAIAEPELKGTPTELAAYLSSVPGTLTLAGDGEIKASADRAVVQLRVDTENKSLAEALRENQAVRAKLAAFLKEQGLPATRVQTAPFSATPRSAIFSDKVKSHKVSTLVKVTTHEEQEFHAATRAVDQFIEVACVGAEFEHSNKEALRSQAIAKACDEVDRQKRLYEEKFGVKLVPRNIQDQKTAPAPAPRRRLYEAGESYGSVSLKTPLPGSRGGDSAGGEVEETPFGELIFTSRVTVEYAVERK